MRLNGGCCRSLHTGHFRIIEVSAFSTLSGNVILKLHTEDPSLPALNEAQLHKLRCMTLIELASRQRAIPFGKA